MPDAAWFGLVVFALALGWAYGYMHGSESEWRRRDRLMRALGRWWF